MDASALNGSGRKYPAYTLAQLKAFVAEGKGNPVMVAEIEAREAGRSVVLKVPQIVPGR